jgi:CDP-diacylglycerol--serine O-phosphatidyltransferase
VAHKVVKHSHGAHPRIKPVPRVPGQRGLRHGVSLLPSLFTIANLFCGWACVVHAMRGDLTTAAPFIGVAIVLDMLDGRIARMTGTTSDFGVQLDSLADLISFGMAPAILSFQWGLAPLGRLGWAAGFMFVTAAALRLARFNTQIGVADKRYFQGLPSPSAAAIVAGMVWAATDQGLAGESVRYGAFALTLVAGVLMVSNVRYHSFKGFDLRGKVPFVAALVVVLVFVLISVHPPHTLFAGFLVYAASGPILTLVQLRRRRAGRRAATAGKGGDGAGPSGAG